MLPFPKPQILNDVKLKMFVDDNFKFNENGTKLFIRVENTVGKDEITYYQQLSPFSHSVFKRRTANM